MPNLSSLVAPKVAIITSAGMTNDIDIVIMKIFRFQQKVTWNNQNMTWHKKQQGS